MIWSLTLYIVTCTLLIVFTTYVQNTSPFYRYTAVYICLQCRPTLLIIIASLIPTLPKYLYSPESSSENLFLFGRYNFLTIFSGSIFPVSQILLHYGVVLERLIVFIGSYLSYHLLLPLSSPSFAMILELLETLRDEGRYLHCNT